MLSKYFSHEFLQIKKIAIKAIGNAAKNIQILLRVLGGKLTLAPPHMLPDSFFSGRLGSAINSRKLLHHRFVQCWKKHAALCANICLRLIVLA